MLAGSTGDGSGPRAALSLRENFSWTLLGNVVYSGSQWLILVVLARLGSARLVGEFTLAVAICGPLFMFANLQLRTVQATDARRRFDVSDYLGLRSLCILGALVFLGLLVAGLGYSVDVAAVILAFGAAKAAESVSDVFYGVVQQRERMNHIAVSQIVRGITAVAVVALFLSLGRGLAEAVAGIALVWLIVAGTYDYSSARRLVRSEYEEDGASPLRPNFGWEKVRSLFRLALPLGLAVLATSLITNMPRYFVDFVLDTEALGYFGAISFLGVGAIRVSSALSHAVKPRLAKLYAEGSGEFARLLSRLVAMCAAGGALGVVGAWLVGDWVLAVIYGQDYAAYQATLVWVAIGVSFQLVSSMVNAALQAVREFSLILRISLVTLVIVTLAGWPLVGRFGVAGAGVLVAVGSLASLLLGAWWLRRVTAGR